ncbi:MAG: alpha/beta hydrolase [bacterium]
MGKKILEQLALSLCIPLCLQVIGCAHFSLNPDYTGPKAVPREIKKKFTYEKSAPEYKETILEITEGYTIKRIEFTPSHTILPTHHSICMDYYDITGHHATPVIIVLPILGGSNNISKNFASYFAHEGYAAVIVNRQKEYTNLRDINKIDMTLCQMVFDCKQAIDWIETQDDLDTNSIGLFGVSMGGIKGSLVSALDDRIKASVFALTAGDIPYILTHSSEKGIKRRRKEIMKEKKLTRTGLYNELTEKISCDPLQYAEYIDARSVLMVLALFDRIVPYAKGKELRKKMGKPETIYLFCGHLTAFPFIYYIKKKSLQFFKKHFPKSK